MAMHDLRGNSIYLSKKPKNLQIGETTDAEYTELHGSP